LLIEACRSLCADHYCILCVCRQSCGRENLYCLYCLCSLLLLLQIFLYSYIKRYRNIYNSNDMVSLLCYFSWNYSPFSPSAHIFICKDICITDVDRIGAQKLSLPRFLHPLAAIIVCCCCCTRRGGPLSSGMERNTAGGWNNSIIFIASSHSRNVRGNICKWILLYFQVGFHYNIVVSSGKKGPAI